MLAHVRTPLSISRERLDGAENWCEIRGLLTIHFTQDAGYLVECTCKYTHMYAHLSPPVRLLAKRRLTALVLVLLQDTEYVTKYHIIEIAF